MHWILRILRGITRRFRLRRRGGRIEMASRIRPIRAEKFLPQIMLVNRRERERERASTRNPRNLGGEKEDEMEFRGVITEREMSMAGPTSRPSRPSRPSLVPGCLFSSTRRVSATPLFSCGNGYVFSG